MGESNVDKYMKNENPRREKTTERWREGCNIVIKGKRFTSTGGKFCFYDTFGPSLEGRSIVLRSLAFKNIPHHIFQPH